jgi:hypothetical protein
VARGAVGRVDVEHHEVAVAQGEARNSCGGRRRKPTAAEVRVRKDVADDRDALGG